MLLVPMFALLLQGCGMTMTRYEPSFDNVQKLKQTPPLHAISNPQVTAESGEGSLMVRANPIKSPTGSIPAHIQDAITEELRKAGLLDPNATRHLQVLVVKNQLNAGMGTGDGKIAARFTILDGKNVVYDATKEVSHQWSSSFFGFIAIPNATNAYNPMLKDLLKDLYSDPQFIQALK
ncbi:YajG family lipoprotein [Pseudomonas sp. BW7P1]|uniref:YajG family lipoprotein n=1 Tax=Pseudomonas TaxID=286 RepID=UPI0021ADB524|nr:YajG family lipoprotein [Pseudomonas sp. BW7P1]UWI64497.1 YajG family lipoprotein [Pseudomonas sp. BW7P1]